MSDQVEKHPPDKYMVRTGLFSTTVFFLAGVLMLVRPVIYTPTFPAQQVKVPYPTVVAGLAFILAILFAFVTISLETERRQKVENPDNVFSFP